MFGEHINGGMAEVASCNIKFLKDEFPSVDEIKKDLKLYELQQVIPYLLMMGRIYVFTMSPEDSTLPVSRRDDENLVAHENQHENEVHPSLRFLKTRVVHIFKIRHI